MWGRSGVAKAIQEEATRTGVHANVIETPNIVSPMHEDNAHNLEITKEKPSNQELDVHIIVYNELGFDKRPWGFK